MIRIFVIMVNIVYLILFELFVVFNYYSFLLIMSFLSFLNVSVLNDKSFWNCHTYLVCKSVLCICVTKWWQCVVVNYASFGQTTCH